MLNSRYLIELLVLASGGLFTTTLVFAVLWIRARERAIRSTLELRAKNDSSAIDLSHLVHGIDAIAVEVERISEAQRFTAQALAGMKEPAAPRRVPERIVTPH